MCGADSTAPVLLMPSFSLAAAGGDAEYPCPAANGRQAAVVGSHQRPLAGAAKSHTYNIIFSKKTLKYTPT